MKLTPAISTRTSTSSVAGDGTGRSLSVSSSGPPKRSMTIARMRALCPRERGWKETRRVARQALQRRRVELRAVIRLEAHRAAAEHGRVDEQRLGLLEVTVHLPRVANVGAGDQRLHPAADFAGHAVAQHRLHAEGTDQLQRGDE